MERINLIDELTNKSSGYKVALFTSFSIDLVFFEKMILRHLLDQNCTYLGLFVDQKSLYDGITKPNISELGKNYIVKGMETNQSFHPKVYLLLGENKAKLIVGSGNLTPAGFITNHEVFNVFTYNETKGDMRNLSEIHAAYHLFLSLHQDQDNKMWQELFTRTNEFTYLRQSAGRPSFLIFNHDQSLQAQLNPLLPDKIDRIECFVPYFDQSLSLINKWNDIYKPKEIQIYLQNKHTNFPRHTTCRPNISLFEAIFQEDAHKRYHGKVFRFIGEDKEVIIYGSGNCSRQAFLMAFQEGGNAEAIVVEEGIKGEFDEFFHESIFLNPLPNPLPEDFGTIEALDGDEPENEGHWVKYVDGIINDKQLVVTIKTILPLEKLILGEEEGSLTHANGDYFTYSFTKYSEQLSPIILLEGCVDDTRIPLLGWFHDPESLQNTFYNMKQSVHFQLPNDPYLEDYHNLVALLDDLHNRLILTENDVIQAQQSNYMLRTIHEQAELTNDEEAYVSDNKDDYYVSQESTHAYGSIGNIDVLGNLIRVLLRGFYAESPLEIAGEKAKHQDPVISSEEVPKDIREQLQKRMKRFMTKFKEGISSDHYMNSIDPDVLIKNVALYSGFLFKLKQKLGDDFLSGPELVSECLEVVKALTKYSVNNIVDTTRQEMNMLLILSLATIFTKEYIIVKADENYHVVRYEKKRLGQLLKQIHQQIQPIGSNIQTYSVQVCQFLQKNFEIMVDAKTFEQSFAKLFPLISFSQFEKRIKDENIVIKKAPTIDEPTILLETEVRLTPEFNFKQLRVLSYMLAVEEWEEAQAFKIRWFNTNPKLPLKRFVLYYNQKKRQLKKKYVYINRDPLIEQKSNVSKQPLQEAAERGDASILGEGFK